jgi:hypothetical protein
VGRPRPHLHSSECPDLAEIPLGFSSAADDAVSCAPPQAVRSLVMLGRGSVLAYHPDGRRTRLTNSSGEPVRSVGGCRY